MGFNLLSDKRDGDALNVTLHGTAMLH